MALDLTISLSFPALPDTDIWFANAAAFNSFMASVTGTAELTPIASDTYNSISYDESLVSAGVTIDGVAYLLVTQAMLTSLKNKVNALDTSYKELRTKLIAAGLIEEV